MGAKMIADNEGTIVTVLDEADAQYGNVHHKYLITDKKENILCEINFQHGPISEKGVNGVQHLELLQVIQHRLDVLQRGPFSSPVNEATCGFIGAAIASEQTRTRRRTEAGVEGTMKR
jgi:hypothetical protein